MGDVIEWLEDTEALLSGELPPEESYDFTTCTAKPTLESDRDWCRLVLGEKRQNLLQIFMRYSNVLRSEGGGGYDHNP